MNVEKPVNALLMVVMVAFVCSVLVSLSAVGLRPIHVRNQLVERSRNIVALAGLVEPGADLSNDEVLAAIEQMDIRVLDIDTGNFDDSIDVTTFDARTARNDPATSVAIEPDNDLAGLGRRSRYEVVYLAYDGNGLERVVLPIVGQGMWSTLYGYVALEDDLSTIAAASFYEQAETAGLGDKITDPSWLSKWEGVRLYGNDGGYRFRVAPGPVEPASAAADFQVDGISGATVTSSAVSRLMGYWFGPDGYLPFIENLRESPPERPGENAGGPQ